MDGKGRWRDNVFVERLWRSVKYEDIYLKAYGSIIELKKGLTKIASPMYKRSEKIRADVIFLSTLPQNWLMPARIDTCVFASNSSIGVY